MLGSDSTGLLLKFDDLSWILLEEEKRFYHLQ